MNALEFVSEWQNKKDPDGTPAVGIGIYWGMIKPSSSIEQYFGKEAWEKIGEYYAPIWGNFTRTKMKEWLNVEREDYQKFIDEEKIKIDFYRKNGLIYPEFCAFPDFETSSGVLGDGCHRYINCNYLIMKENPSFDVSKCRLDVVVVENLSEVLTPTDFPPGLSS